MAHDEHVGAERLDRPHRVDERFALPTDDVAAVMLTTSADSFLAATSNETRVRVEAS